MCKIKGYTLPAVCACLLNTDYWILFDINGKLYKLGSIYFIFVFMHWYTFITTHPAIREPRDMYVAWHITILYYTQYPAFEFFDNLVS